MFLIPAGYCGGSPVSPWMPRLHGQMDGVHQALQVQTHLEGLRIYVVPESIFPLGLATFFPFLIFITSDG